MGLAGCGIASSSRRFGLARRAWDGGGSISFVLVRLFLFPRATSFVTSYLPSCHVYISTVNPLAPLPLARLTPAKYLYLSQSIYIYIKLSHNYMEIQSINIYVYICFMLQVLGSIENVFGSAGGFGNASWSPPALHRWTSFYPSTLLPFHTHTQAYTSELIDLSSLPPTSSSPAPPQKGHTYVRILPSVPPV